MPNIKITVPDIGTYTAEIFNATTGVSLASGVALTTLGADVTTKVGDVGSLTGIVRVVATSSSGIVVVGFADMNRPVNGYCEVVTEQKTLLPQNWIR